MKKLAFILSVLLCSTATAVGPIINSYRFITAPSATYLVNQGFEGAGYDNSESWSETGGTVNEDYAVTALSGSQSLNLADTGTTPAGTTIVHTSSPEVWGYCLFRIITLGTSNICIINDGSGNPLAAFYVDGTGKLNTYSYASLSGTVTTDAMSTGVTYSVWWHYAKGTGANAVLDCEFATTTTKVGSGTKFTSKTNAAETANAGRLQLGNISGAFTFNFIYDYVRLDDVVIGSAPP